MRISVIARHILLVLTTSVPSECIFSAAGLLINRLRNRLSCDIVDGIIFLNKNRIQKENATENVLIMLIKCSWTHHEGGYTEPSPA